MKKTIAASWFAMTLAGCAMQESSDGPADAELIANAGRTAGQDRHQMTGSRLKDRTSTDRMLKAVGAQSVRDDMNNAPRPLVTQ